MNVGDTLVDNDPRMKGRKLVITEVEQTRVRARDFAGQQHWYKRKRIFEDLKLRRSGMTCIPSGTPLGEMKSRKDYEQEELLNTFVGYLTAAVPELRNVEMENVAQHVHPFLQSFNKMKSGIKKMETP